MAFTWPDGSKNHSISWAQHQANLAAPQKGLPPMGGGVSIGGKPVTTAQWQSGALANALVPGSYQPPAAPSPGANALPPDPILQGMIGALAKTRDEKIGALESQKPQVLAGYGYKATGYDAGGAPTGLSFDADNPFSQAALLKRRYDQQQTGTQNSMAARGQLYSGALQNQKTSNELGYQGNSDAIVKALTAALKRIAQGVGTAKTDYETGVAQAAGQRAPTA